MNYIYADFNSICICKNDPDFECINLSAYGTLSSLNEQRIHLKEGDKYIFFDPKEIEVEGEVFFDKHAQSRFSDYGCWFAKIKEADIKISKKDFNFEFFPCFNCGRDMSPIFLEKGWHYNEICPNCNTSITYALSPPASSVECSESKI